MSVDIRDYRVFVEPLTPDLGGGFVSFAPQLPGCVSDGATPDEAIRNLYGAIVCWVEAAKEKGDAIPLPVPNRQFA